MTGFGTQIITGSIERQLGGKAQFEWRPEGLCCTLTVPRGATAGARTTSAKAEAGRERVDPSDCRHGAS